MKKIRHGAAAAISTIASFAALVTVGALPSQAEEKLSANEGQEVEVMAMTNGYKIDNGSNYDMFLDKDSVVQNNGNGWGKQLPDVVRNRSTQSFEISNLSDLPDDTTFTYKTYQQDANTGQDVLLDTVTFHANVKRTSWDFWLAKRKVDDTSSCQSAVGYHFVGAPVYKERGFGCEISNRTEHVGEQTEFKYIQKYGLPNVFD